MSKHHFQFEKSSAIDHVSHDDEKNILTIKFLSGSEHHYKDCSKSHYDGLISSKSAGKYFHQNIRGKFDE